MMKAPFETIATIARDATVMVEGNEVVVVFGAVPPQAVRDGLKARGFRFGAGKWTARPRAADDVNRALLRGEITPDEAEARIAQIVDELAAAVARELAAAGLRVVRLGAVDPEGVEYEVLG
jgi:hypothetical protein